MLEFITNNSEEFETAVTNLNPNCLGAVVRFYTNDVSVDHFNFAIVCVDEVRGNNTLQSHIDFESIKLEFYNLYKGNWNCSILDLGIIHKGNEVSDTYYALKEVISTLLPKGVLPIVLGGSQDLSYPIYRAYDKFKYMINISNIDHRFDLGDSNDYLNNENYLSHMVVNKPYNLFNYANLGYQSYFNSTYETELLDKMFFETYRLGEIFNNVKIVEPVLRDSDFVTLDIRSIESRASNIKNGFPNGFSNREICAITRYAGFSNKVSCLGVFELQYADSALSKQLLAEMLWYFVEGYNFRIQENVSVDNSDFLKYKVPIDDQVLIFYESKLSGRWWIEIPTLNSSKNNKLKQHTLLPCDKQNYISACNQELPERWLLAKQKNEF